MCSQIRGVPGLPYRMRQSVLSPCVVTSECNQQPIDDKALRVTSPFVGFRPAANRLRYARTRRRHDGRVCFFATTPVRL